MRRRSSSPGTARTVLQGGAPRLASRLWEAMVHLATDLKNPATPLLLSIALLALTSGLAAADTATIRSGSFFTRWDGQTSGLVMDGDQTHVGVDFQQASRNTLSVGSTADLSVTLLAGCCGPAFHRYTVTINGTTFTQVYIWAQLTVRAVPFVVPAPSTLGGLATAFTMSGTIEGFSDAALTAPVFSTSLAGQGVAEFGWNRFINDSFLALGGGGTQYTFTSALPPAWTSVDIGSIGLAGDASVNGSGELHVGGAGADVWGGSDSFQFTSSPATGAAELIARVRHERNTHPFAKAGLMIRESQNADARHVILDAKPDGTAEFMTRSSTGGSTTYLGGATLSFRPWLRLSSTGTVVTGSVSSDGTNWTVVGSVDFPIDRGYLGFAVTSHDPGAVNQALFDSVTLTTGGSSEGPPSPWAFSDIGAVGSAGHATGGGADFQVGGAGADIWGGADSFAYLYQPISGDGGVRVVVNSIQNTHPFAKAGIMLRSSTQAGAAHVILDVKPDGGIELMARTADGAQTQFIDGISATVPVTLQLERTGSTVTALAFDQTGLSWQRSLEVSLPVDALTGIAVTSHDRSQVNVSTFSRVAIVKNLVINGDFEASVPPATQPGWVSDTPFRQADAVTTTTQPRGGLSHGECSTQTASDCGLYQDIAIDDAGSYMLTLWANSDRAGAYVGYNVNGVTGLSTPVAVGGAGDYARLMVGFVARPGDIVRVWLYAPATPGTTVIDDVDLRRYLGPR